MQKQLKAFSLLFYELFSFHRILLSVLMSVPLSISIAQPNLDLTDHTKISAKPIYVKQHHIHAFLPKDSEPIDDSSPSPDEDVLKDEIDTDISNETSTHEHIVSKGDAFSTILHQYDVEQVDIRQLIKIDIEMHHLQVGQKLSWTLNEGHQIEHLIWERSQSEKRYYDRTKEGFKVSILFGTGELYQKITKVVVNGSFINSAKFSGLNSQEIREVITALQWQIDFRKLHDGDYFEILTMHATLNGAKQHSDLLGVRFCNVSQDYYAIRAADGKFYDRNGSGLTSGFMRFPTFRKYRVSSPFNPRRKNPITGRIAPHKGVDFAVPIGTPVLSIGNGEVIVSTFSDTAGNYIAIRHGRQYMTRYMHLKTLFVKKGQKVKRGEYIALSGNTGRSTGPHIHFETWINNQAVNPLTARLPSMACLTGKELLVYLTRVKKVLFQLHKE
ncbi:Murein DD-endopeptidase MepM [Candidatus Erwinia haradaeae]|uniref:Murein DD-endopeptidase MepM n=1 Tax=Candidatus Erwinia haradaeae TaxID=1922217 RepID=A0A451DCW9_9GAMM|nr:murein DD-endopeptidase MepM [Candidatus Erwinia haradaeae]VFP84300.1 Murein DD-endopeptidase MepM [Candidatus Erwinia haradaeae]